MMNTAFLSLRLELKKSRWLEHIKNEKTSTVPYKEKQVVKRYYTIHEVAEVIEEPVSTIRHWESEFSLLQPKRNQKEHRLFTQDDLQKLKMIHHLMREKLYTTQGARNFLKNNLDRNMEKLHCIDSLKKIKGFLVELRDQLQTGE